MHTCIYPNSLYLHTYPDHPLLPYPYQNVPCSLYIIACITLLFGTICGPSKLESNILYIALDITNIFNLDIVVELQFKSNFAWAQ